MPDLTEEEYDALDEKWTKNPPKPGPNGTGFFAQRKATTQAARSIVQRYAKKESENICKNQIEISLHVGKLYETP
jgi:hypothetical protein